MLQIQESSGVPISPIHNANTRNNNAPLQSRSSVNPHSKKRKEMDSKAGEGVVDQEARRVPSMKTFHLLSWLDVDKKVVAAADLCSKDPKETVHFDPLGHGMRKVWVCEVYENIPLIRPNSEFTTLSEALGSTVVWPVSLIKET